MIVRLFCPQCAFDASKALKDTIDIEVPVPVSQLADDGIYEVRCGKGHVGNVILKNVKFELLFEMGLNALVDGYHREAVSSFASALERYYEFYWRVAMTHLGVSKPDIEQTWKPLSKMSERQIGAFSTAALILTKLKPNLLNPNKQVSFRNQVIHNGYIPKFEETIDFGNSVMNLINEGLDGLRRLNSDALLTVYEQTSPRNHGSNENDSNNDKLVGCVNILTAIDVRHPPKGKDNRIGDVSSQMDRILCERQPKRMQLLTENEMQKKYPEHTKKLRDG